MKEYVMSEPQSSPTSVETTASAPAVKSRGPSLLHLGIVVGILAVGVVITALTADVTQTSEPGIALADGKPVLAEKFGEWAGGPQEGLSQVERDVLPVDTEGARRVYKDDAEHQIFCSVVLAGRDVTSIHRPEVCLPGQGWKIQSQHVENVPIAGAPGGGLGVMRLNTVREVPRQDGGTMRLESIFAYWFVGKDRVTPHHWERILWNTKDRVFHNTNHRWAYILIHAPVNPETAQTDPAKAQDEAMKVVARFVQDLYPTLVPTGS
jgi:EpsI family protein